MSASKIIRVDHVKWVQGVVMDNVDDAINITYEEGKRKWVKIGSEKLTFARNYTGRLAGVVYLKMMLYSCGKWY